MYIHKKSQDIEFFFYVFHVEIWDKNKKNIKILHILQGVNTTYRSEMEKYCKQ